MICVSERKCLLVQHMQIQSNIDVHSIIALQLPSYSEISYIQGCLCMVEQCQSRQVCEKLNSPLQTSHTNSRGATPSSSPPGRAWGADTKLLQYILSAKLQGFGKSTRKSFSRWKKQDEECPPCSTLPTEPEGVEALCFSDWVLLQQHPALKCH